MNIIKYTIILLFSIAFFSGCDEIMPEQVPTPAQVKTSEANEAEAILGQITLSGEITFKGDMTITSRGVCVGLSPNPDFLGGAIISEDNADNFSIIYDKVKEKTTYYYRAFAQSNGVIFYGSTLSFKGPDAFFGVVTNNSVINITATTATSGGSIIDDRGYAINARGVCWSTSTNPTINDSRTKDGTGTGSFKSTLTGLTKDTKYYVRAYATNKVGTIYGEQKTFTTRDGISQLSTSSATNITATTATSGGSISFDGGSAITARGICWGTNANPTIDDSKTKDGNGIGSFTSILTGLTVNTSYYVRAYATNSLGTTYGAQKTFVTKNGIPKLSTKNVTYITATSATCGGYISDDGGYPVTVRGVCWSTSANPTINDSKTEDGNGTGNYTANLTGLTPNTTYFVRAYATNSMITSYGAEKSFTTNDGLPVLTTDNVIEITNISATSGGNISSDGGFAITVRGICWSINTTPTINDSKTEDGTGTGGFTSMLAGLTAYTTYYVRAYATNSIGTNYGDILSFKTTMTGLTGTLTDIEGNTYKWVGIGNQAWMAENLKVTKDANGTAIPMVTDDNNSGNTEDEFRALDVTAKAYYWYNDDITNKDAYGALYTYTAAKDACPTGWHLPSKEEWDTLINYVSNDGFTATEGTALKTSSGWFTNNGTDNYSFSALPAGCRSYIDVNRSFSNIRFSAYWWTSTISEWDSDQATLYYIHYDMVNLTRTSRYKFDGHSIRCVRDE